MIAVYAGRGSSHSWTWFAHMCSSLGVRGLRFLSESEVRDVDADTARLLVISGGDGFEIADSIGTRGLERMREYVSSGGTYVGMCAGAYMALPSTLEPFRHFNISTTKIRNISHAPDLLNEENPRLSVRYGSCSVFHPVRGAVVVEGPGSRLEVPLYGGPVFSDTETDETLLRYSAFTSSSAFQVDRGSADRLMIGHPAAIMASYGKGRAFLFGPHLEHPEFPRANNAMAAMIGLGASPGPGWRAHGEADLKVRRSIADLKVAILGLENTSFVVGRKLWDGGRLLELVEAIERWSPSLTGGSVGAVTELLDAVADSLRSGGEGEVTASESAPHGLVEAARICANLRFGSAQG